MTNRLRRILQLLTVTLLLSAIIPGYAMAQGSEPTDDEVNAIAKQLYCPVCENISLDACGTAACEQWRNIMGNGGTPPERIQLVGIYCPAFGFYYWNNTALSSFSNLAIT